MKSGVPRRDLAVLIGYRLGAAPHGRSRKKVRGPSFTSRRTCMTSISAHSSPHHGGMGDSCEQPDPEGEPFFIVHGVRCKAESYDSVRMGMQLPSKQRVKVKMRIGESRCEAILRHDKFPVVKLLVNGARRSQHAFLLNACVAVRIPRSARRVLDVQAAWTCDHLLSHALCATSRRFGSKWQQWRWRDGYWSFRFWYVRTNPEPRCREPCP